uniref:DDE Tnp4 domain-containing protein n=1 Tax=Leptobrachium leishanense TaxID=445787 RepID=A0A8C5MN25_9ANUR
CFLSITILDRLANPARVAVPRVFLQRVILKNLSDRQILKKFQLSREAILSLYQRIRQDLEPLSGRGHSIPGLVKLLAVLYHFAKHSFQADSGEEVGISQASFSRCLTQVVRALTSRAKEFIHFPTDRASWRKVKLDFFQVKGFPKVLGAIDCTHVALRRPTNHEELYRNRKQFHSLNVQVVCDADQRIMSVRPGNPGSFHDSRIWQESSLATLLDEGQMPDGDKGYACQPWLLTPLRNPQTPAEVQYNSAHCATRNVIERTFGVLKYRFLCLDKSGGYLLYSPLKAADIVLACCILHNVALMHRAPVIRIGNIAPEEDMYPLAEDVDPCDRGPVVRVNLIATHFHVRNVPLSNIITIHILCHVVLMSPLFIAYMF